jgi:hypothetical protein
MRRQRIKPSIRWSIFYRDGFACRYCGAQAGEEGVELHIDHALSVYEGGDNRIDNLITACQQCNVGKGARSLIDIPTSDDVIKRITQRRAKIEALGDTIREAIEAKKELEQEIVNIKCEGYGVERTCLDPSETTIATNLVDEFGPDLVIEWYSVAASHRVPERQAIRYVCGCARKTRGAIG